MSFTGTPIAYYSRLRTPSFVPACNSSISWTQLSYRKSQQGEVFLEFVYQFWSIYQLNTNLNVSSIWKKHFKALYLWEDHNILWNELTASRPSKQIGTRHKWAWQEQRLSSRQTTHYLFRLLQTILNLFQHVSTHVECVKVSAADWQSFGFGGNFSLQLCINECIWILGGCQCQRVQ